MTNSCVHDFNGTKLTDSLHISFQLLMVAFQYMYLLLSHTSST